MRAPCASARIPSLKIVFWQSHIVINLQKSKKPDKTLQIFRFQIKTNPIIGNHFRTVTTTYNLQKNAHQYGESTSDCLFHTNKTNG